MNNVTSPLLPSVLAVLRTIIAAGAGWFIGKGYLTSDQIAQLSGVLVTLVTMGFAIYSQVHNKKQLVASVNAAPGTASLEAAKAA